MFFFEKYIKSIVNYDFINKFLYRKIDQLPFLKKISLNITYEKFSIQATISSLIALEMITSQKAFLLGSNKKKVNFVVKEGNLVGCKVILRDTLMYVFLNKFIYEMLPIIKISTNISNKSINSKTKTFQFKIKNVLNFYELEQYYNYFKNIASIDITIITNTENYKEFYFLLKTLKLVN